MPIKTKIMTKQVRQMPSSSPVVSIISSPLTLLKQTLVPPNEKTKIVHRDALEVINHIDKPRAETGATPVLVKEEGDK